MAHVEAHDMRPGHWPHAIDWRAAFWAAVVGGLIFAALEMPMVAALVRDYRAADGAFQIRLGGTIGGRVTAAPAGSTAMPD